MIVMLIIERTVVFILMAFAIVGAIGAIRDESKGIGREFMFAFEQLGVIFIPLAAIGASLLTAATIKVVDYFKSKKKNNEAEIEKAKEEIIKGIKEYDATHPDEEGGNEDE